MQLLRSGIGWLLLRDGVRRWMEEAATDCCSTTTACGNHQNDASGNCSDESVRAITITPRTLWTGAGSIGAVVCDDESGRFDWNNEQWRRRTLLFYQFNPASAQVQPEILFLCVTLYVDQFQIEFEQARASVASSPQRGTARSSQWRTTIDSGRGDLSSAVESLLGAIFHRRLAIAA